MKAVVFCEGTTDLLMIQFVLQYKYGWKYDGFVENTVSNRLMKRILVKDGAKIEIRSCGGITNSSFLVEYTRRSEKISGTDGVFN